MDNWSMTRNREEDNQIPEYELPPVGVYQFELVGKDPDQKQKPEYDPTGEKYRARFHWKIVDDEDWDGTIIKTFYNLTLNEQGYWLPVVEALLGRTLGPSERVGMQDTDNTVGLLGLRMMATLKHDAKTDNKVYPRLESPFPVRKARSNKKATTSTPQSTEPVTVDEVPF